MFNDIRRKLQKRRVSRKFEMIGEIKEEVVLFGSCSCILYEAPNGRRKFRRVGLSSRVHPVIMMAEKWVIGGDISDCVGLVLYPQTKEKSHEMV